MRTDSPFYSHCVDVLHESPLFADLAETTLQDMLLSFHRETWKKNAPAMSSSQTLEHFYLVIAGRLKIFRINPDTGFSPFSKNIKKSDGCNLSSRIRWFLKVYN